MAQTGFTPIQLYYSSTTTNVPLAADLANGELAINITDGKLFYKDNANAVQVIGWKVVPATAGGTGQTSYAVGDLIYANTTTTLAKLPDVATGNALISGGVNTAPAWGKIGLTTHVSGVLPVANGGTNASTASITSFNNITGYTASGATGTTSTNLVFSTNPSITTPTLVGDVTLSTGNLVFNTTDKGVSSGVTNGTLNVDTNGTGPIATRFTYRQFMKRGTISSTTFSATLAFTSQGTSWSNHVIEFMAVAQVGGASTRYGGLIRYIVASLDSGSGLQGPTALGSDLSGLTASTSISGNSFTVTFTAGATLDNYSIYARVLTSYGGGVPTAMS